MPKFGASERNIKDLFYENVIFYNTSFWRRRKGLYTKFGVDTQFYL